MKHLPFRREAYVCLTVAHSRAVLLARLVLRVHGCRLLSLTMSRFGPGPPLFPSSLIVAHMPPQRQRDERITNELETRALLDEMLKIEHTWDRLKARFADDPKRPLVVRVELEHWLLHDYASDTKGRRTRAAQLVKKLQRALADFDWASARVPAIAAAAPELLVREVTRLTQNWLSLMSDASSVDLSTNERDWIRVDVTFASEWRFESFMRQPDLKTLRNAWVQRRNSLKSELAVAEPDTVVAKPSALAREPQGALCVPCRFPDSFLTVVQ